MIDFEEGDSLSGEVMMFTEFRPSINRMSAFANAILERAASECGSYADREAVRALKIKEGE